MSKESFIQLFQVSKKYQTDTFAGVKTITASISKGKVVAIVGESGSGKSTLLKLIYGLLSPDEGSVYFKGELILGPDEKLIPGHDSMKMVTQDFSLNTFAKVYDNVASMLPNTNLKYKEEKSWEIMKFLRIDHLYNKRVSDLSGGEQQRVAIARAIITEPEVLLMDEPFSQVDTPLKTHLRADIKRLSHDLGITVILVSHDPVDGLSLADDIIVLNKGEIIESGSPEQLYNRPQDVYTSRLLADCNILSNHDAKALGLKAEKETIAIYPEWIELKWSWSSKNFILVDAFFKGIYEELLLEKDGIRIRAINRNIHLYKKGASVPVILEKFIEF
ncbi:ABC transporter ATP-binding protein [Pedobacter sp. P351]|uniref:ABC transporter ATP-binding protein n=1 Tax=Pedobacter superstes TaxID=3133441 RepID=UPI0030A7A575